MSNVSPQPRGAISNADQTRIRNAMDAKSAADDEMRSAVLSAAGHGASVRELAAFTGLSTNTISRWKRDA
jgi:DNA-directed RNA polymerase specialized sigma24 family protein